MSLREKGISPPPKPNLAFEELRKAKLLQFPQYLESLYKWLLRVVDASPKVQTAEPTINPGTVAANSTSEQSFAVNGLQTQDIVYVTKPTHTTGIGIVNCRCSADDTLAITFMNSTGAGIDPPSETYLVCAIRR